MSMALSNSAIAEDEEESLAPQAVARQEFSDRWLLIFVVTGFSFELGLWFLGDTALRLPLRIGMYVTSLAFVFLIRGTGFAHPAARVIQYILVVLIISMVNPLGSTLAARFAQV